MLNDYTHVRGFFSNSLDTLWEMLKKNLFPSGSTPFSKRVVIVPSPAMEAWLERRCAETLSIAAGITFSLLDGALPLCFGCTPLPSRLSLLLHIEAALADLEPEWEPLYAYLKGKEKRRWALAQTVAPFLIRQGVYGIEETAKTAQPTCWQEALAARITPYLPLPLLDTLRPQRNQTPVHLFAFSHLPAPYFSFFSRMPSAFFYQLSPCQEFWSDGTESHPLLTAYGRVGREIARQIEESSLTTEEAYLPPSGTTQLARLQRALLFLEPEEAVEDDSLELHRSTTPYQEVKNLHATLCHLLNERPLEPRDLLILAPDISCYAPFIRTCFEGSLPYKITDLPRSHPQLEGFWLWLQLEKTRFSAPALLALLRHPLVQKKRGWDGESVAQIERWITATGICWGLDDAHRRDVLYPKTPKQGVSTPEAAGTTWQTGIGHLLEELAIPYHPTRITFSQAELLGEWKEWIDQLTDMHHLLQEHLALPQWADRLLTLYNGSFAESDQLAPLLEKLATLGNRERTYSFTLLEPLLEELFQEKGGAVHPRSLQAISCGSLLSMRAIPAKVICLLGMNHDTFPRSDREDAFSLTPHRGYCPSRSDFDRYLFLETLLSAQEKVILSYLHKDPYEQMTTPPSSVILPLLPYIGRQITHPDPHAPYSREAPEQPPLFAYRAPLVTPEVGPVSLTDFLRAFRSPLHHYLFQRGLSIKEPTPLAEEEPLHLSPLQRAILRKSALAQEDVWKKATKAGFWPLGPLRTVAEAELREELARLPHPLASHPLDVTIGGIRLVGTIDGFFLKGWCAPEKKTVKGAVRAWPLFLLATLIDPHIDSLLFLRDQKRVARPFDDPIPLLKPFIEAYGLATAIPAPLFPEWIDALLQQDGAALAACEPQDTTFRWAMRGQTLAPPDQLVTEWHALTKTLYQVMYDAWF